MQLTIYTYDRIELKKIDTKKKGSAGWYGCICLHIQLHTHKKHLWNHQLMLIESKTETEFEVFQR